MKVYLKTVTVRLPEADGHARGTFEGFPALLTDPVEPLPHPAPPAQLLDAASKKTESSFVSIV